MAKQACNCEKSQHPLLSELKALQEQVAQLELEKQDLQIMLDMTTEHSDTVEEELFSRAEETSRESERKLRLIIEATPVAVVISEVATNIIVFANEIAGPLMGLTTNDLVGRNITDIYADPSMRTQLIKQVSKDGKADHVELEFVKKDGESLWADVSTRPLVFDGKSCVLSSINDIGHLKQLNEASRRFVPREYLSFLEKDSLIDIKLGDHVSDEMTVMFSDLRSFTSMSEEMTPQQNFDFINAYLGRVSPVVRNNYGFIVKYLGDGIMAIFPGSADSAVQAGIDKVNQVNSYNVERAQQSRQPIGVGIGVNTGHMMVGMVGEEGRMQGDAFSDDVNLTSRIESLTKHYSVSFIITAATKNALFDENQFNIRFLDKVQVKGKQKTLVLYEVYDADLPHYRTLKQESHESYERAMEHYYKKEFTKAQAILFDVLQKNPKDKVAWHHLIKATQCLDNGVPENWTGVTVMTAK